MDATYLEILPPAKTERALSKFRHLSPIPDQFYDCCGMRTSLKILLLLIGTVLIMGNTHPLISLAKTIENFGWEKRLVLLIADNEDIHLIRGVASFFTREQCENNKRNLELYTIIGDEITKYQIPKSYEGRKGIWLIGYDGGVKAYSEDLSLLDQLHDLIDAMPVRRNEMLNQVSRCN